MLPFPSSQSAKELVIVSLASALTMTEMIHKWARTHGYRLLKTAVDVQSRLKRSEITEKLKSRALCPRVFPAAGSVSFPVLKAH